ncbi:hypothetical protein CCUS01_15017 [Colletotrichum cuscutae]|uniref:Uncharacterized protein n=1 Tax=Colletotrichum cuscutae TaxID=1209917 RepID=A0AAI9Y810_9PEZI|nr:hypothetical protein CCUS01_15017 [Colletotrichum cuscutae]
MAVRRSPTTGILCVWTSDFFFFLFY